MSYNPQKGNVISVANSTAALLTGGATFTGVWENVTNYTTVASTILGSLATDGTIYFDLSTDGGSTFTSVPSTVGDTTFAVPRIINVVETHIRIRYVNGTTPMTGTFSIQTKYSNGQQMELLSSVDGFVSGETPTAVVRAVATAKDPQGNYKNVAADGTVFSTTALLADTATYDSGVLNFTDYSQVQTEILASHDGTIDITFYADSGGTDVIRSLSIPYVAADGYQFFSAPTFGSHVKYEFTNEGGVTQTDMFYTTKFFTKGVSGQLLTTGAFIVPSMVANLGRNIIAARQPSGIFKNDPANGVAITETGVLGNGAVYTSDWIDSHGYNIIEAFISTSHISAVDGIEFEFTDNLSGTPTVRFSETYSFTAVDVANDFLNIFIKPKLVGFRVKYTNGATLQTDFLLQVDVKTNGTLPASLTTTSNDSGSYQNLNVVSGARPSQLVGRTEVEIVIDGITADNLEYTVTASKTLYITDMLITVDNAANALGRLNIRDGLTVVGTIKIPLLVADPGSGGDSATLTYTHTFAEPMPFNTGVFIDEVTGTLTIAGTLLGYEE